MKFTVSALLHNGTRATVIGVPDVVVLLSPHPFALAAAAPEPVAEHSASPSRTC